jgi:hypothetical protein
VGKTRLVSEVCAQAEEQGAVVLWGRCVHFGAATSPYAPIVVALEGWLAAVDSSTRREVMAEIEALAVASPDAPAQSGRVLRVVERLFARVESHAPVILVVDDLQWADVSSLDLLAYLVAGFRHQRMAILVTFRDTELADGHPLHAWVADLRRLPSVHQIALGRLDETETEQQLTALLGRSPSARLTRGCSSSPRATPTSPSCWSGTCRRTAAPFPRGFRAS